MSSSERGGAMEDLLENISKNSNPKNNYYIVINNTESGIKKLLPLHWMEKDMRLH